MEDESTERSVFPWTTLLLVVVLFLGAVIVVPNFRKARTTTGHSACIPNLKQIDAAKEQWALENKKSLGTRLTREDIAGALSFLKNSAMPVCPNGGVYTFRGIGEAPTCTFPGHTL
jgi:hypothetical protein